MGGAISSQRSFTDTLYRNLFWLSTTVLFDGGNVFAFVQVLYRRYFDTNIRQKVTYEVGEIVDHENSKIVGRNRRPAHAFLRSLKSTDECLRYWSDNDRLESALENIFYLTGEPGKPINDQSWKFRLVGSPKESPAGWELPDFKAESASSSKKPTGSWDSIALPGHWQLQGYDTPLYTNTVYPFAFDPPRARRNGTWTMTTCDLGLGAPAENEGALDPKEPGENATGLYRKTFKLPDKWTKKSGTKSKGADKDKEKEKENVFMVFEGVDCCANFWLDGVYIGFSKDSCLPCEFDVTKVLREKGGADIQHVLAVQVMRWSDASYLEDQDKWWLSGIYREAYFIRKPAQYIADFEFSSDITIPVEKEKKKKEKVYNALDDLIDNIDEGKEKDKEVKAKKVLTANVNISVLAGGVGDTLKSLHGEVEVQNKNEKKDSRVKEAGKGGKEEVLSYAVRAEMFENGAFEKGPALTLFSQLKKGSLFPSRGTADEIVDPDSGEVDLDNVSAPGCNTLIGTITDPKLWTAETPNLYVLVVSLYRSLEDAERERNVIDVETSRVGIRDVQFKGTNNLLSINSQAITVAGVNRHEFDPVQGRCVSVETMREDARIMKQLNFNAARCSHYPQHRLWLEICDEAGLYVVDEANIETHGFQVLGQPVNYLTNHPDWQDALLSRVSRMYERDKNSASVIIWSLGNESGCGRAHSSMSAWLRARDPRRPVQYEGGGARSSVTDIICPMYKYPDWCLKQIKNDAKKRPLILCEYAHAMGNSGGGLADYWELFYSNEHPRMQGGFIWDFVDQGLSLPGGGFGYGGDFGDSPNSKQFCINGLLGPDRAPHPSALEAASLQANVLFSMVYSPSGDLSLAVLNRRGHTDLSDVTISISLCCNISPKGFSAKPVTVDCRYLPPGKNRLVKISDLFPCLEDGVSDFKGLCETLGVSDSSTLGLLSELWFDVCVRTIRGTPWVPANHVIVRRTLTDEELLCKLKNKLPPLPYLNEHLNFPPFVTVTEVDGTGEEHGSVEEKSESAPLMRTRGMEKRSAEKEKGRGSSKKNSFSESHILVEWSDGSYATVGSTCGRLTRWFDSTGRSLLSCPLDVCFWRAPTDNDSGGGPFSHSQRWRAVGLDTMSRWGDGEQGNKNNKKNKNSVLSAVDFTKKSFDGSVTLKFTWTFHPSDSSGSSGNMLCGAVYTFLPKGGIHAETSFFPPCNMPPLPRQGVRFSLPARFSDVEWMGLGPHEAYTDRMFCCHLGTFESSVEKLHEPYVVPQENGRRAEPRWIAMKSTEKNGKAATGIVIIPISPEAEKCKGWGFSASLFSMEQLENTAHNFDLKPDDDKKVYMHVDSRTMGLGGYDSWCPNVTPAHLLETGQLLKTTILLLPLHGTEEPSDLYLQFLKGKFQLSRDGEAE